MRQPSQEMSISPHEYARVWLGCPHRLRCVGRTAIFVTTQEGEPVLQAPRFTYVEAHPLASRILFRKDVVAGHIIPTRLQPEHLIDVSSS